VPKKCVAVVIKVRALRSITVTLLLPYYRAITFHSYNGSKLDRAITIRSDNDFYDPRAITIRSDNDFYDPRAITIRSDNFSPQC
jgi:hypothetical protein